MRLVILPTNPDCKVCKGLQYYYQGDIKDGMMLMCNCHEAYSHTPHSVSKRYENVAE